VDVHTIFSEPSTLVLAVTALVVCVVLRLVDRRRRK
jgi:hypothetical protein